MGSNGVWCSNCAISLRPRVTDDAKLCCSFCGKVVGECNWSEEVISFNNADQQCKRKLGIPGTDRDDNMHFREDDKNGDTTKHMASDYSDYDDSHGSNIMSGESDTFSDIDDHEDAKTSRFGEGAAKANP